MARLAIPGHTSYNIYILHVLLHGFILLFNIYIQNDIENR